MIERGGGLELSGEMEKKKEKEKKRKEKKRVFNY